MSYPTTPIPAKIGITSYQPSRQSLSQSGKRQSRTSNIQRWQISVVYPLLSRDEFAPIWAFAIAQKGGHNTFKYAPEIYKNSNGTATGILLVNGVFTAGDSTIAADGITGTLKAGDFIKFSGHDKVYMISSDTSTSLEITPPLYEDVADDEVVDYNGVEFTMSFERDEQKMSVTGCSGVSHEIALVEVVV